MTTAVKVDEDAKSRLEELQAEIRLRTGQNVTQQELLSRLIDTAYESRDDVIDSFRESTVPLTDDEKEAIQRGRFSSGVETTEDDIDETLYGERAESSTAASSTPGKSSSQDSPHQSS